MEMRYADALRLAEDSCRQAGVISLDRIDGARATRKGDRSLVTETDHEIQSMITTAIRRTYPDHAVLGEESEPVPQAGAAPDKVRFCWVIDPLDGTRNYVARLPCFATSVALLDRGVPVVGVVYEHNTGEMISAIRGGGATRGGQPVRVSTHGAESDHLLGIPSSKQELALHAAAVWHATRGYIGRNLGSTAYEMALVAAGVLSGMLGTRVKIWDIAAGTLLVEEAGGVVTDPIGATVTPFRMDADPQQDLPVLAASRAMHSVLLRTIMR